MIQESIVLHKAFDEDFHGVLAQYFNSAYGVVYKTPISILVMHPTLASPKVRLARFLDPNWTPPRPPNCWFVRYFIGDISVVANHLLRDPLPATAFYRRKLLLDGKYESKLKFYKTQRLTELILNQYGRLIS